MFRKIVANLAHSPALIVKLSSYSKKIKLHEKIRGVSIICLLILLIIQVLVATHPPESSNTAPHAYPIPRQQQTSSQIKTSLSVINSTNDGSSLKPNDRITISLTLENTGDQTMAITPMLPVADILEYADIIDAGGAHIDTETYWLIWPDIELTQHALTATSFTAKIVDPIPATAIGQVNSASYDCTITTSADANSRVTIPLHCPYSKHVETFTRQLPRIANITSLLFVTALLALTCLFFIRDRIIGKEIKIIRSLLNAGGLE